MPREKMTDTSLLRVQEQASNRGLVVSAFIILLSSTMIGMTNIFSTVTLPLFVKENVTNLDHPLDKEQGSWYVSIMSVSGTVGICSSGIVSEFYGKKNTLLLTNSALILSWVVIYYANIFELLLLGRFITGLCVGVNKIIKYLYMAELSTIRWRGALGTLNILTINTGYIIGLVCGKFMPMDQLTVAMVIPSALFVVLGYFFLQESPLWLVKQGDVEGAEKALAHLRGKHYNSSLEVLELMNLTTTSDDADKEKVVGQWKNPVVWKPIVVVSSLFGLAVLSGADTLTSYSLYIFAKAQFGGLDPNLLSILMQLAFTVGFIISLPCMVRVRRRSLLMFASLAFAICMLFIGVTLEETMFMDNSSENLWKLSQPFVLLLGCLIFGVGFSSVVFTLFGEIFHPKYKTLCAGLTYPVRELTVFLCLKSFFQLESGLHLSGMFILFGLFSLATCIFAFFFIPETKDLSLTEISNIYSKKEQDRKPYDSLP